MKKNIEKIKKLSNTFLKNKNSDNYCFYNPPNLASANIEMTDNNLEDILKEYKKYDELSLYINIPFCLSRCLYCNYFLYKYNDDSEKFLKNFLIELELLEEKIDLKNKKIASIYFGGGTPSCISEKCIKYFFSKINQKIRKTENCEITFECYPEENVIKKIDLLRDQGVTRLSFGIESMDDKVLSMLNRRHNSYTSKKVISYAKNKVKNINIDLIYGLPGQKCKHWIEDLRKAIALETSGITIYRLSTFGFGRSYREQAAPMSGYFKVNSDKFPDEIEISIMYLKAREILLQEGFIEALVGFFIKPSILDIKVYRERWAKGLPVYGLGLGSFSYGSFGYLDNLNKMKEYKAYIEKRKLPIRNVKIFSQKESLLFKLLGRIKANEIFYCNEVPSSLLGFYNNLIDPYLKMELIRQDNDKNIALTNLGRIYVDRIAFDVLNSAKIKQ